MRAKERFQGQLFQLFVESKFSLLNLGNILFSYFIGFFSFSLHFTQHRVHI